MKRTCSKKDHGTVGVGSFKCSEPKMGHNQIIVAEFFLEVFYR